MRSESLFFLGLLNGIAVKVPPSQPLSPEEIAMIQGPLEATLYKYGTELPPEWQLIGALAMVALGRYPAYKAATEGAIE